jgi:2-polyprenyl-3-methyl-5-hydroxy-6-metoxy-1,4-benzoquinol methylase
MPTTNELRDDHYPLESGQDEIARLRVQAESLAGETAVMLDRIGLDKGTSCLDLGCGAGSIVDLLAARTGPGGRVVGIDADHDSLAAARTWARQMGLENVSFEHRSLFEPGPEAFDFVHLRYVITTIGRHQEVVAAALARLKPGGVLAIQEADGDGIAAYPTHPAFESLKALLLEVFEKVGAAPYAGRQLFGLLQEAGLEDLDFRACTACARSHDTLADYLPQTVLSVHQVIAQFGLMADDELDATIAACRAHLAQASTISVTSLVFQAWGRKPE